MERVEKVLLLAVLGVALMIVAVMSFLPDEIVGPEGNSGAGVAGEARAQERSSGDASGTAKDKDEGSSELAKLLGPDAPRAAPGGAAKEVGGSDPGPLLSDISGKVSDEHLSGTGTAKAPGEGGRPDARSGGDPSQGEGAKPTRESGARPALRQAMAFPGRPGYLYVTVREGENLGSILAEVCGSVLALQEVCAVNEALDPDVLVAGQRILIPKTALRWQERRKTAGAATAAAGPPAAASAGGSAGGSGVGESYEVVDGDSLWRIAARRVGNRRAAAYVTRIQELNPQASGTLRVGLKLILPPLAER